MFQRPESCVQLVKYLVAELAFVAIYWIQLNKHLYSLGGYKVSVLARAYPHKLMKIKGPSTIMTDSPLCVWLDVYLAVCKHTK